MHCDPTYKKHFLYPFISRVYKLLEEHKDVFVYKRLRGAAGLCDIEDEQISVDPFHCDVNTVSVTIHEALHWFYPEWNETKVLAEESKIMHNLSKLQLKRLTIAILEVM